MHNMCEYLRRARAVMPNMVGARVLYGWPDRISCRSEVLAFMTAKEFLELFERPI